MSAFIRMLWSGRERRINPDFQERAAWYSLHPAQGVQAAPQRPPVSEWRCQTCGWMKDTPAHELGCKEGRRA